MGKKILIFVLLSYSINTIIASQTHSPTVRTNFPPYQQQPPMVQVIVPNSSSSNSQAFNRSASNSLSNNQNHIFLTNMQKAVIDVKNKLINSVKQVNVTKMISSWQQSIKTYCDDSKKRALGFFAQLGHLLYDHKFKLMAMGIGITYGYLFFRTQKTKRYLRDNRLWSSWKQELSLEKLFAIPQEKLSQELLAEIQARYVEINEPTNFLSPMAIFIQETDAELTDLKQCASFSSWTVWLGLSKLLPFGIKKEEVARERIQRLIYFKNLFSSWIAQYKITSNTPKAIEID